MSDSRINLTLLVMLATFGIVSCSSNTQSENTGIGVAVGAVTGGVAGSFVGQGVGRVVAVGVGAIAGGLIGGSVGNSMDSSDHTYTYEALNTNHTYKSSHWRNERTGAKYSVIPTSNLITINGNPNCRNYRAIAIVNGEKQESFGTACRQADGSWRAVNRS